MKRVLVIQDISCVGRCSMTVSLPVLSAWGLETCILPTAVLSTHTGGFAKPAVRNLSDAIADFAAHWLREGIRFDGVLVGYLGSVEAVEAVGAVLPTLCPAGMRIVDPAMADNGKLYSGLNAKYVRAMTDFCGSADLILPNVTEAELLTGRRFAPENAYFAALPGKTAVVTGQTAGENRLTTWVWDGSGCTPITHTARPGHFHGTGDLFAACLTGGLLTGTPLAEAADTAARFTAKAVELAQGDERFGLPFEQLLSVKTDFLQF